MSLKLLLELLFSALEVAYSPNRLLTHYKGVFWCTCAPGK